MRATFQEQSNVANLPPPVLPETLGHYPPLPSQADTDSSAATARPRLHSIPRLTGPDVTVCLADAIQNRWRLFAERHRRLEQEFSEENVHELRVASRRLISQFDLLGSIVSDATVGKGRRVLRRRVKALGALRDTQLQCAFIAERLDEFPELAAVYRSLQRRERSLLKGAAAEFRVFKLRKIRRFVDDLLGIIVDHMTNFAKGKQLCSTVFWVANDAYLEVARRQQAVDLQDLSTVHSMRIAFKRFRYIMEALSPHVTGFDHRKLRTLAGYQRRMGAIQDLVVIQNCVSTFAGQNSAASKQLDSFSKYLLERRTRAVRSFARSADKLSELWPEDWPSPKISLPF